MVNFQKNNMLTLLQKFQNNCVSIHNRTQCITMFLNQLKIDFNVAKELEECICKIHYINTIKYIEEAKRVCFNIKCNSNILKKYKVCEIPFISNEEMARGTLLEKIKDQENQRAIAVENMLREKYENVNKSSEGGLVRCKTCGSTDIAWQQKQTRGADEAMTIFCTCSNCKTRWKMS